MTLSSRVRLLCLRHGESENVITGTAGVLLTAPLTPHGRDQSVTAAKLLGPEPVTRIYCSTAARARETADIIGRILGIEAVTMADLLEVGIGTAEGAHDQATRARTAEVLHAWIVQRELSAQVADGETGHEVVERITAALTAIADSHPGRAVAVVGHVASLTVGLTELCELGSATWGVPLPHAVPFLVERDGNSWSCGSWPAI
jgi:alpha-ribazole phosphatase/probable phosphoglycerate mutase